MAQSRALSRKLLQRKHHHANMTLNPQQQTELLDAAKPLIKWLNDNCHPHCEATVDTSSVEIKEGVAILKTIEFIKD